MLTKKIELRVPSELFNTLKVWARQKNTTISDLARYAIGVVYYHKKNAQKSPLTSVLGIIDDKGLAKDIDKQLYGGRT